MRPLLITLTLILLTVFAASCGNKVPLSLPSEAEISLNIYGRI